MATYKVNIIDKKNIAEGTIEISFNRPHEFDFQAGQYIQVSVDKLLYPDYKGNYRVLSIASSPLDNDKISVAFRDSGSGFKETLKSMSTDETVYINGPYGYMTIPDKTDKTLVFLAGGIGITPYLSMIRYATEKRLDVSMVLIYANRSEKSAAYLEELKEHSRINDFFTLKSIFGKIASDDILKSVKDIKKSSFYIAGPPGMVDYMRNLLFQMNVDCDNIHYEEFAGY